MGKDIREGPGAGSGCTDPPAWPRPRLSRPQIPEPLSFEIVLCVCVPDVLCWSEPRGFPVWTLSWGPPGSNNSTLVPGRRGSSWPPASRSWCLGGKRPWSRPGIARCGGRHACLLTPPGRPYGPLPVTWGLQTQDLVARRKGPVAGRGRSGSSCSLASWTWFLPGKKGKKPWARPELAG